MKALVLKTQGSRAAVLLTDGTFRVARGEFSVGETFDYFVAAKPTLRQLAATAAAMIVMLGAAAGWWVDRNYVPYAEISLDVNPSIVYSVNKRDRVLSVSAVNDDAKSIVKTLEQEGVQFASVPDAVGRTLSLLEGAGYLDEAKPDYVLVNVSADDEARQDSIVTQVETAMRRLTDSDPTVEYRIERSDRETAREAEDSGMSPGRYAAWKVTAEAGPETAELGDYAEKPVSEIIEAMPEVGSRPKAPVDEPQAPGKTAAPEDGAAAQDPREEAVPEQKDASSEEAAPGQKDATEEGAAPEQKDATKGEAAPGQKDTPKGEPAAKPEATAPVEAPSGEAAKPQDPVSKPEPVERESDSPAEPARQDGADREAPPSPDDKAGDAAAQDVPAQQERLAQGDEEKSQEAAKGDMPMTVSQQPAREARDAAPQENAPKTGNETRGIVPQDASTQQEKPAQGDEEKPQGAVNDDAAVEASLPMTNDGKVVPTEKEESPASDPVALKREENVTEEKPVVEVLKPRDAQPEGATGEKAARDKPGEDGTSKGNAPQDNPGREKAPQVPKASESQKKENLPVGDYGQAAQAIKQDGGRD